VRKKPAYQNIVTELACLELLLRALRNDRPHYTALYCKLELRCAEKVGIIIIIIIIRIITSSTRRPSAWNVLPNYLKSRTQTYTLFTFRRHLKHFHLSILIIHRARSRSLTVNALYMSPLRTDLFTSITTIIINIKNNLSSLSGNRKHTDHDYFNIA